MNDAKKDDSNFEQNGLIRNRIWAFYYDEEHFGANALLLQSSDRSTDALQFTGWDCQA